MSDDTADSTIVKGIVCLWIKEWWLENAGREADLVGGRVIVSIDSLRSHKPL